MPTGSNPKCDLDGALVFKDVTGTIATTVKFMNGDFSMSELQAKMQETVVFYARGKVTGKRKGQVIHPTFQFTAQMSEFTSALKDSLMDVVRRKGAWAAAGSCSTDGDLYTVNAFFVIEGTTFGDSDDHDFSLGECELTIEFAEGSPNMFTVKGTVYGALGGDLA